jgi:hypothetical protein
MKKPHLDLWLRQRRLAKHRARERLKRKTRRWVAPEKRYVIPGEVIRAPSQFELTGAHGIEVAKFLRAVSDRVLGQHKPVILDLRLTHSFWVPATILFYAELDRIVNTSTLQKPVTIRQPRLRKPREVLKQIGMFELTGDSCDLIPEHRDVIYWRVAKGANQSGDQLKLLEPVAERANEGSKRQVALSAIWRGISEAVANTVDHAYIKPREDPYPEHPDTKWWMFTQLRGGYLIAAVCDLGCGYSATIDRFVPETVVAKFKEIFQGVDLDSQAIQTAMEYGRSRTRQDNRGKGSRDARAVLERHGIGELVIASNSGWVQYEFAGEEEPIVTAQSLGISIKGTIIWWKLPVS